MSFLSGISGAEGTSDLMSWKDAGGQPHVLNADISITADDTRTCVLTTHPVESGADVADHIVHDPDKFMIQIAQTQTPLLEQDLDGNFSSQNQTLTFKPSGSRGIVGLAIGAIGSLLGASPGGTIDVTVVKADSDIDRVAAIHDKLIDIKQQGYPVDFAFKGRQYTKFIITSVKLTHAKGEFGLGRFELQAQQFRTVATATTILPDPKTMHAKPAKVGGKKPTTDASGEKSVSLAKSFSNGLGITNAGSGI